MSKPRTVGEAIKRDFIVTKIYSKGSKKIRVTLKPRFFNNESISFIDFWIDRDYFQRTYARIYDSF